MMKSKGFMHIYYEENQSSYSKGKTLFRRVFASMCEFKVPRVWFSIRVAMAAAASSGMDITAQKRSKLPKSFLWNAVVVDGVV